MKICTRLIFISFISSYQLIYAQVDSIEYNYWKQIYDFGIENNQYYFKTWEGETIEKDSLLFDSSRFFANHSADYSNYCDSVQFVITSRTLKKFYNEEILFNKQNDFIRICFLRDENPIIIRFEELKNESIKISFRIGNGNFNYHGDIINDTTFYIGKKHSRKIQKNINENTFNYLRSGVICANEIYSYDLFYFEFLNGKDENTIVIDECNIKSSDYKNVYKFYEIAKSISKKEKLFSKAQKL